MQYTIPDPSEIIARLKDLLDVESDAKLAEMLGVPPSTLANWRRRRSLPYPLCVRIAQERGISLDWLILGKKGLALDSSALALAAYHSRDALPLLELGEVEADVLGQVISKWYGEYAGSLDRVVATGRTREQATRLLYNALTNSPRTGVIAEAIELQSQSQLRPSGTPESSHAAPEAPNGEELTKAPEASLAERSETSVEHGETPNIFRTLIGNVPAGHAFGQRREVGWPIPVAPGPEHLSPDKFHTLQELIREVADPYIAAGSPQSVARWHAWRPLLKKFDASSARLIPKEFGDRAIAYMEERAAEHRSRPDEADYAPWRTQLYIAINNQARKLGYSRDELYAIAVDHFGQRVTTLKQLSDDNLETFYGIIMATKRGSQRSR